MVLVVAVVVAVALVRDGTMVYVFHDVCDDNHDGDDNHDVCDGQTLRVEYKRLVDEHESKRQHHQMATMHPTMCTCKSLIYNFCFCSQYQCNTSKQL